MSNFSTLLGQVEESQVDESKDVAGFARHTAVAGLTTARFIGYVEIGKRPQFYDEKEKAANLEAYLFFEFNSKKNLSEDGKPYIHREKVTIKFNEKAKFRKLFNLMAKGKPIKRIAQMLGEDYLIKVFLNESNGKTYVNIRDDNGYQIKPPIVETVDDDGNVESKRVSVPKAVSAGMLLLWDHPTKEQWDSIFIDGEYTRKRKDSEEEETVSKNWLQRDIVTKAVDFEGSALHDLLVGMGAPLDFIPEDDAVLDEPPVEPEAPEAPPEKPAVAAKSKTPDTPPKKVEKAAPAPAPESADDILAELGLTA